MKSYDKGQESEMKLVLKPNPTACSIFHHENIAILASYFTLGLVTSFITNPLNVYLVTTLDAEPAQQNAINILQTLPWSLKLVFGFLSDAIPVLGMHRKPYLLMGVLLCSGSFFAYGCLDHDSFTFLSASILCGIK